MKTLGMPDELHNRLKNLSKATGILQYRLIQESVEYLETIYKEKLETLSNE